MNENTLILKVEDGGAGGSPSSSAIGPGDQPAEKIEQIQSGTTAQSVSEMPKFVGQFNDVIERVSKGLLTFDEGLERVEKILNRNKDEIVDYHREAGANASFQDISAYERQRVGDATGKPVKVNATDDSRAEAERLAKEAANAKNPIAEQITKALDQFGLGRYSPIAEKAANYFYPTSTSTAAGGGAGGSAGSTAAGAPSVPAAAAGASGGSAGSTAAGGAAGGGAGGVAGALAAITEVAGPLAIALLAAKLASEAIGKAGETARAGIVGLGQAAASIVSDDTFGMVTKSADALADGLEKTGLGGKILAEELRTATAAAKVFSAVVDEVSNRAKQLSGLNGDIAQAAANQDVSKLYADMNEADQLGTLYASVLDSQTSLQSDFREIMLPIKEIVVGEIATLLRTVADVVKTLKPVLLASGETVSFLANTSKSISGNLENLLQYSPILKGLLYLFQDQNDRENRKEMDEINRRGQTAMEQLFNMQTNGIPPGVRLGQEERQVNIPLLGK